MKVYVAPQPGLSRAMDRVAAALQRYRPADIEIVTVEAEADLVVLHVIGYPETVQAIDRLTARGQRYAMIQYCLRSTQEPHTVAWLPLWQGAVAVWSYYHLPAMMRADGVLAVDEARVPWFYAPMGAEPDLFPLRDVAKKFTILTTGYVAESEAIRECAAATNAVGGQMFHLGNRDLQLGDHVLAREAISDDQLALSYARSRYVAGLRRSEGFEMPAVEGLLCGARPVMFDAPHYRAWFGDFAEFIPEADPETVTAALRALFANETAYRPVTPEERARVAERFAWSGIIPEFWERVPRPQLASVTVTGPKRRVLWVGDAGVSTGFARATHYTCDHLHRLGWDVQVVGINYDGTPHRFPYPIYPAQSCLGGDAFGVERTAERLAAFAPDVVVIQQDPWNFPHYLQVAKNVPTVGLVAVDGKNCRGSMLNGLSCAVFWTRFGQQEALTGGYHGYTAVVPLGVDPTIYRPLPRMDARQRMLSIFRLDAQRRQAVQTGFIVGNVNRNQPRKRLDLCIEYFAEWIKSCDVRDAYLYLHVAPTGDRGYDCAQLARYYGVRNRLILKEPEIGHGDSEADLVDLYNGLDLLFSTTQGEGWSLPTMEAMACGTPCVVPDWSALSEWTEDAARKVPCRYTSVTPDMINTVGGIADKAECVQALDDLYRSPDLRDEYRRRGLALTGRPCFRWPTIGQQIHDVLEQVLEVRRPASERSAAVVG